MHDALNELAQRGAPRGFDHVLAAAAASSERDADAAGNDLGTIPFVSAEPAARKRRRPLGSMIAAAGVAALVLVGAFAVSAVVGGGGGAGSAEGAVQRLADAISHGDPLAAADVLAPEEVRSLHGTIDSAERKAAELKLVTTAGAPLAGVDFNIDGLKLSTDALGDGYAKVTIDAGTFSATTHHDKFSPLMQKVLRDTHDGSTQGDLSRTASGTNLPTFVVVVRESGRWYVSAAYTVLEYVREYNHLPAADFGSGENNISTLGADSPDAAVQGAMRALGSRDWSKLMSLVPPNEIPVYDYRAALDALIQKSNPAQNSDGRFTISTMTTKSQVDGDTAKVLLSATGTTDSGSWSLDGGCFTPPASDVAEISAFPCVGSPGFFGILGTIYGGLDQNSSITAVEDHGRWFVSPVGTVLDVVDHLISQLDRRSLYTTLNIPNQIPPDGPLTLGQPITMKVGTPQSLQVLSFVGQKGQNLIGLATETPAPKHQLDGEDPASVRVFGPDGSELGEAFGILDGQSLTLPADGTYTFVLQARIFDSRTATATVTLWDAASAPAAAKVRHNDSSGSCTYTIGGGESCVSTSVGSAGPIGSSGSIACPSGEIPIITPPSSDGDKSSSGFLCEQGSSGSVGGGDIVSSATTVASAPGG